MSRESGFGICMLALALAGCGDDGGATRVDARPPIDAAADAAVCAPQIVFLDRDGGLYRHGAEDDSSANVSFIVQGTVTLPPPTVVAAEWAAFVTCVRQKFAPFDIVVTDQDPGAAEHTELVVIDHATQIGQSPGVVSIAPFRCADGGGPMVFRRGIPFLMWSDNAGVADRCWNAAMALGSSFGLDHAFSCPDLMTWLNGCGAGDDKTFTDADVPCGEASARACTCGGDQQNSYRHLLDTFGAADCR